MTRRARAQAGLEEEVGCVLDLTHEGEGVLREAGGKAVFVAGALPGERIRYRRTRHHRQHDEAVLVAVEEASPLRAQPRCAHFGVCGGCALQHLAPHAQLEMKRAQLREALQRIGRIEPERWLEDLVAPVWAYRRRARLGAKYVPKRGEVLVGFRERRKPYVAALSRCEILAEPLGALVEPLSRLLTGLEAREAIAQIEVAVGEAGAVLVLRNLRVLSEADRAQLRAFEQRHGVRFYLQPAGLDSIHPLHGEPAALAYSLPDFALELAFGPVDFVQVNAAANRALVAAAIELLDPRPQDHVLDLFCGLGNFSLALARRASRIVGVEGDAALVARAASNAQRNGIGNAAFFVADLATPPDAGASWAQAAYTGMLLDPPRVGAEALMPWIAARRPARLVYVSCHPGTLARDLGRLVHEHGWRLAAAGVADMFPHTTHVESIALLEPR